MTKKAPIVLVDMDGVVADFERGFIEKWKAKHPDKPHIELEDRTTFYSTGQYPLKWRPLLWEIMKAKNFFADFQPVEGSIKAVKKMAKSGFDVYFCSSPFIPNPYCASEKYDWINKYFGRKWVGRLILAPDKTLVHGDILIDDRPEIKGALSPTWEHILYDQPYNREIEGRKRLTWANWQDVIK
jgi:5'-nucleotidase